VLFINTAASKIPYYRHYDGLSLQPSVELITDRKKLASFLDQLIPFKEHISLIVVDIFLGMPAEGDSLLQEKFNALGDKVLAVSYMPEVDSVVPPGFRVPYALSAYFSPEEVFFKYPVAYKNHPTIPHVMYEKTSGAVIEKRGMFFRQNRKYILKSPVTDIKVTMNDFDQNKDQHQTGFAVLNLETLTSPGGFTDKESFGKQVSGKIIMIGDFSTDIHKTVRGPMPGVLMLYNAYLTYVNGENVLTLGWLLLMIAGFTWITYQILSGKGPYMLDDLRMKFTSRWVHILLDSVDEIIYLIILTAFSYFLFNIHLSVLILFLYLKFMEVAIEFQKNPHTDQP
jgi:hypothetical protein